LQEKYNTSKTNRDKSEELLKSTQQESDNKRGDIDSLSLKVINSQKELDKVNKELLDIKQFNSSMLGEIAVAKTTTYQTDESLLKKEQLKKDQV
jgi:hypothetical protein